MSLLSEYINQYPDDTKRLIGIDYQTLQQLIDKAIQSHKEIKTEKEKSKIRIIAGGGGRKPSLSEHDEILLTLAYLRQHTNFQWLGIMFNVCEATANNIFHHWLKILKPLLPSSLLEEIKDEDETEEILDILSDIELIVDSSEQCRQRPTDKEEREKLYSGYKHEHTSKNFCSSP